MSRLDSMTPGSRSIAGTPATHRINVGRSERLASHVGAGALVVAGIARGGWVGLGLVGLGAGLFFRARTGHCPLYEAIGASTADDADRRAFSEIGGESIRESITIDRPADELFRAWREYTNLPKFMKNVVSVEGTGKMSHWVMAGPLGTRWEYDAEIIDEQPGSLISWKSVEGGSIDTIGSVHFQPAPGGRGVVVRVDQRFDPPAGRVGAAVASMLGHDPSGTTRETLRRFKQWMEAGEIATTEGQPVGGR